MATRQKSSKSLPADFETVRRLALALPEVTEGVCYGTPAFRVKNRLFARLREDGETLVLSADPEARDAFIKAKPDTFFVTDHYVGYEWVLVRLPTVSERELHDLLLFAWRRKAPSKEAARHGAHTKK
ncbi:MAG: MmcQ/YjbR family DNA-binding protein [Thermoanaerobaculia bacterium]